MGKHRWSALSTDETKHLGHSSTMCYHGLISEDLQLNHYYGFGFSSYMGTMISGNSKFICRGTRCEHHVPLIPSARSNRGVPLVSL